MTIGVDLGALGRVTYYENDQNFVAHCADPLHAPRCKKSMSGRGIRREGRPLGFLFAWLRSHTEFASAWDHCHMCHPTHEQRKEARADLKRMGVAQRLFDKEAPKAGGDDSEPY